jgi:hypothetical protein
MIVMNRLNTENVFEDLDGLAEVEVARGLQLASHKAPPSLSRRSRCCPFARLPCRWPPGHPLRMVWSPQVYWQNSKSEVRGMWFYDLRELNQISQSMQQ